jgi:ribosome biogenesis GTPase
MKEKLEIKKYINYYRKLGIKVYVNTSLNKIKKEFIGSVVALCGQTGSGKSSLLNRLDVSLKLKTGEVSLSLGRGKHTTRLVELLEVNNGLIADTPGFSSLDICIDRKDIKKYYPDFNKSCKYRTCLHIKEDGCKIIELVNKGKIPNWRYENYIKFMEEVSK